MKDNKAPRTKDSEKRVSFKGVAYVWSTTLEVTHMCMHMKNLLVGVKLVTIIRLMQIKDQIGL